MDVYIEARGKITHKVKEEEKMKTRKAYGTHKESGKVFFLGDTVAKALDANMMVRDYEKKLIKLNPQLNIVFKVEKI